MAIGATPAGRGVGTVDEFRLVRSRYGWALDPEYVP
jgi:hypothetical protein